MKLCLIALFLTAFAVSVVISEKTSYQNYRLLRLIPKNSDHIKLLNNLEYNTDFDIWNGVRGIDDPVDVSLSPASFDYYKEIFDRENLPFTVIQPNLQELFDAEERTMKQSPRNTIVGKYARYSEITNYISTLVEENPDIASTYVAGNSYQGRDLKVLVIKTPTSKRAVWIDSGIHAREWISPSSNIWIIDKLITSFRRRDPIATELLSYYEFHFLPIVNPDGYEFTHTTTRLWRKNRAPNPGSTCVGTDLNRNFAYQWNTAGSSNDPCSDIYGGSSAASEVETQSVQNAILKHIGKWDVYVNIHTYGLFWMPIWSYTTTLPDDYADILAVSKIGVEALKAVNGLEFTIGSPANIFSPTGGGTIDWVRAIGGVKYAFGLELRPGQSGPDSLYGFMLPEDRIPLAGEETYQGLMAMIAAVKAKNAN